MPPAWVDSQSAGKHWFTGFMKRNSSVSIQPAEATSLARAVGFNRIVVRKFFENLKKLHEKYKYGHRRFGMQINRINNRSRHKQSRFTEGTKTSGASHLK